MSLSSPRSQLLRPQLPEPVTVRRTRRASLDRREALGLCLVMALGLLAGVAASPAASMIQAAIGPVPAQAGDVDAASTSQGRSVSGVIGWARTNIGAFVTQTLDTVRGS